MESRFWGPGIGVAGLLTGSDFIAALRGKVHGDFVVLPSESMIGDDYLFLDDLTLKDVERELGVEVIPSGYTAGDFVERMRARWRSSHGSTRDGLEFVRNRAAVSVDRGYSDALLHPLDRHLVDDNRS